MTHSIDVRTTLPNGGQRAHAVVSREAIAVRIDDRICVAHQRWMTEDEARTMAQAVLAVLDA